MAVDSSPATFNFGDQSMRLCSYIVKYDKGFAPNPFHGLCTLAACTPNHQGLRLENGDWILGNSTIEYGHRLIYAMRISEVLNFDDYYRNKLFAKKKASNDSWQDRCGDNIYYCNKAGEWQQGATFHHQSAESIEQDTRHPHVFISDHFYYFGVAAPHFPAEYKLLARKSQGCKCSHDQKLVEAFIAWLEKKYDPGKHGDPRHRDKDSEPQSELVQLTIEPRRAK
jgi:hypothetical protein